MKKFLTLVAAAAMTLSASAQEKEWNISNFEAATFTAETTIDGLTIYATEKGPVTIDANNKTVDGVKYTQRLKTGGAGSITEDGAYSRIISFDVPSNGTVSLIAASSSSTDDRVLGVSFGQFLAFPAEGENPAGLYALDIVAGSPQVFSVEYKGADATKVYIYSKTGGVNFYDLKFTPSADLPGGNAFEWTPMWLTPDPSYDIYVVDNMGNVTFNSFIGDEAVNDLSVTDVMPVWIDDEGNELKASSGVVDPYGWDSTNYFQYTFDTSSIKANGEYTLVFPEGMLVNAAGEKSAEIIKYYTLNDIELAPAMFDDFEVLTFTPELSQPQSVWNNQVVTINTNHNEAIAYTKLIVTDLNTEENVIYSTNYAMEGMRQLGDKSPITWTVQGDFKFFKEHVYRAEVTFYNGTDEFGPMGEPTPIVAKATYDFTGLVEGYKFSSVKLEGVTPWTDTVLSEPSQAVFTYTFSGPVNVYKAVTPLGLNGQVNYPDSCLSANEDKTVWTLDLSDNEYVKSVDTQLSIVIYARDDEGYQVEGNVGVDENSGIEYNWNCEIGAQAIVVVTPEAGQTIDRLDKIVVKSVSGDPMGWSWTSNAYVLDQLGLILGWLSYDEAAAAEGVLQDEIVFTEWADDFGNVTPIDLVKGGYYSIRFEPGCFNFGEEFSDAKSRSLNSTFIISGDLEEPVDPSAQATFTLVAANPASGSTVTSLEQIVLTFPSLAALTEWTVDVYKEGVEEPVAVADVEWGIEETDIFVNFREPITEAGTYTLTFKEGVICDDAYDISGGTEGTCNPEFKLVYTIDPDGSGVVSVAVDSDAVYYDLAGRRVLNPSKGIYIVGGKKVVK